MLEFIFYIKNNSYSKSNLLDTQKLNFVKQCEHYINDLKLSNKLIAAQPLLHEAIMLTKVNDNWVVETIQQDNNLHVGYYHIRANSIEEAIDIAKENPEFNFIPSATIEIREIKTKESQTNFVYPIQQS